VWHGLPQTFRREHTAPLEPCEVGAAKHLALQQFQACDLPLHRPITPGQSHPGFDRLIIIAESLGKALEGAPRTLRGAGQPGLARLGVPLAHEVRKVLRQVDGLSDFDVLCAQLGEWLCGRFAARLGTPDDQPSGLPCRQEWAAGLGHDRERRPRWPRPRGLALRLAQALPVTSDGGIAPRIAPLLQLAGEAQGITAAGVPPFEEIRLIGVAETAAPVSTARVLWQGDGAEIAKPRTLAEAQIGGNGMARPAVLPQRPHLLMALNPAGPALGCLLLASRWRGGGRRRPWCRPPEAPPDDGWRH
jgi:hypothetical protein